MFRPVERLDVHNGRARRSENMFGRILRHRNTFQPAVQQPRFLGVKQQLQVVFGRRAVMGNGLTPATVYLLFYS